MRSRGVGFWMMMVFTVFWASWAVAGPGIVLTVLAIAEILAAVVLTVSFLRVGIVWERKSEAGEVGPDETGPGRSTGFGTLSIALAVEAVAMVVVVLLIRRISPDLIQPAIAVIVGLHFVIFYLSPATRSFVHLITMAFSVIVGGLGIWAVQAHIEPSVVHGWVAVAMACVTLFYGQSFARFRRSLLAARLGIASTLVPDEGEALVAAVTELGARASARLTTAALPAVDPPVTASDRTFWNRDGTVVPDSADLAAHVGGADWVIDVAPLTDRTERLVGAEVFAAMDETAVFINVGRGDTVDTDALVAALEDKQIAGAGLDVFDEEPLPAGHPLWGMDNVLITPHMSGDTDGWRMRLARQFHRLFELHRAGEPFPHTVDKRLGYVR